MQTRSTSLIIASTVVALALSASGASAATIAQATTPLNIRTGPGPEYPVIGAIPDKAQATISGCIAGSRWCQIAYAGKQGWAYSQYLIMNVAGQTMSVSQARDLPPVTYTAPAVTVGTAVAPPTISGDFIAPTATAAPLSIAPPPPTVQTYVVDHPVTPVYLNGEVVQGVGLPPDVALAPVPNTEYNYAYVNGVPVLVEPTSRRVTYIYR